jgi:hypothetical protein
VPHHEQTHLTVDHQPGQHLAIHTEDADPQARQRTARRATAILEANPELTVSDIAHAYAAVPSPDPDVLALLAYLARQTLQVTSPGRPGLV